MDIIREECRFHSSSNFHAGCGGKYLVCCSTGLVRPAKAFPMNRARPYLFSGDREWVIERLVEAVRSYGPWVVQSVMEERDPIIIAVRVLFPRSIKVGGIAVMP